MSTAKFSFYPFFAFFPRRGRLYKRGRSAASRHFPQKPPRFKNSGTVRTENPSDLLYSNANILIVKSDRFQRSSPVHTIRFLKSPHVEGSRNGGLCAASRDWDKEACSGDRALHNQFLSRTSATRLAYSRRVLSRVIGTDARHALHIPVGRPHVKGTDMRLNSREYVNPAEWSRYDIRHNSRDVCEPPNAAPIAMRICRAERSNASGTDI